MKINRHLQGLPHTELSAERPRIILTKNCRAVVDGCERILIYQENMVRFSAGKQEICFTGSGLELCFLQAGQLILTGVFDRIEYFPAGR